MVVSIDPDFLEWTWEDVEPRYADLEARALTAETLDAFLRDWSSVSERVDEIGARLQVATTTDTADAEAERRMHAFLDEIYPRVQEAEHRLTKKLLDSSLEPEGFEAVLRQMQPEFFLVPGVWKDRDFGAMAKALAAELSTPPTVIELGDDLPSGDPSTLPDAPPSGDDVRWVYYTSGTTSEPKGVQHTDQTLMAGGRGLAAALDMSSDDLGSIAFPYSHIGGPDYLLMMLSAGFGAVERAPARRPSRSRNVAVGRRIRRSAISAAIIAKALSQPNIRSDGRSQWS